MQIRNLLVVGSACAAFACASPKKEVAVAPANPAPAATAATPAKPAADAKKAESAAQQAQVSCLREKDVRTFAIEKAEPKGCELMYNKFGNSEKVAWSEFGHSHCEQVRDRMMGNLEAAGFQCGKDAAQAKTETPKTEKTKPAKEGSQAKAETSAGPKPASN